MANPAIELGQAKVSGEGTVYLLNPSKVPVLRVLSSEGKVTRTLKLKSPAPKGSPFDLFAEGSNLIVAFQNTITVEGKRVHQLLYASYNLTTGEISRVYEQKAKGIVACIKDNRVIWLGSGPQKFTIGSAGL